MSGRCKRTAVSLRVRSRPRRWRYPRTARPASPGGLGMVVDRQDKIGLSSLLMTRFRFPARASPRTEQPGQQMRGISVGGRKLSRFCGAEARQTGGFAALGLARSRMPWASVHTPLCRQVLAILCPCHHRGCIIEAVAIMARSTSISSLRHVGTHCAMLRSRSDRPRRARSAAGSAAPLPPPPAFRPTFDRPLRRRALLQGA